MKFAHVFILLFFTFNVYSQSDDVLAKSYFLKAQKAYSEGDNVEAHENLEKTLDFLSSTNAKIEAMFVKVAMNQKDYINAEKHLSTYFDVADSGHSAYNTMLSYLVDVKEGKKQALNNLEYHNGLARIKLNGKYGFYDEEQNLAIPAKYDYARSFQEGMAEVKVDNKFGYIDNTGKVIVPIKYDDISNYGQQLQKRESVNVKLGGKTGLVNIYGELVPPKYDEIGDFQNGLAKVSLNSLYGFINEFGKLVIPIKYHRAYNLNEHGLIVAAIIRKDGVNDGFDKEKHGAIDKDGNVIIPFKYASVEILTKSVAKIREYKSEYGFAGNFGFFSYDLNNQTGQEISGFVYELIYHSSCDDPDEQLIKFKYAYRGGHHQEGIGYINFHEGTNTTKGGYLYYEIGCFREGLAAARLSKYDDWGFIDKNGEEIIKFKYDEVEAFSNGIAKVTKRGKTFFIDKSGNKVR